MLNETYTLENGVKIPKLGYGTWMIEDDRAADAVKKAIALGYRHIDTAEGYQNEASIGQALKAAKIERDEIFVTTKVMLAPYCKLDTRSVVEKSLRLLKLDKIDLYLVHWPMKNGTEEAYQTLLDLQAEGKIRSVGVSNFTPDRFEKQFFKSVDTIPSVNQIERHPFARQQDTVDYCMEKEIQVMAYSPLARSQSLSHPTLLEIASSYSKTPAQIVLRWHLQHGIAIIPKSTNPQRIAENAKLYDFHLDADTMQRIDRLNKEELVITWRPEEDWF